MLYLCPMNEPLHLPSAADAAHELALEIYRFTARWPECEREGLTLDVRSVARELSSCLAEAGKGLHGRALRRAIANARGKHARLSYLIRFATDLGYRKLSSSSKVDDLMSHLDIDLGILAWEAYEDEDLVMIDGVPQNPRSTSAGRIASGVAKSGNHRTRRKRYG